MKIMSRSLWKKYLLSFAVVCCLFVVFAGCQNKKDANTRQPGAASGERGGGRGGPGGGPGGGRGGMMGGGMEILMNNEEARNELGVTDEQKQKLEEADRVMRESMPRPEEGQRPDPTQRREQMEKMQTESRKIIEAELSAEQLAKLDVMIFQQSGGLDGRRINVDSLRALDLTDDQKAKIQDALEKMNADTQGISFRDASEEDRQKMQTAREEFQAALKSVLTEKQLAKTEELMQNVPEYLQRQGGPGGPGGGRPGQGPPG